jgi:hypothetical protein
MKNLRVKFGVAVAALLCFGAGIAIGEQTDKIKTFRSELVVDEQLGDFAHGEQWAKTLAQVPLDPELMHGVALNTYFDLRKPETTNRLLLIQAMQNQRIIELLEKQAK